MKKLSILLIGILLTLSSFGQDTLKLPTYVVNGIIRDLIIKDGMEFKLSMQDSIIHIYEHRDSTHLAIIGQYKLNEVEYEKVIKNLRELLMISEAQNKDLKKEIKAVRRRAWITVGGVVLLILLL